MLDPFNSPLESFVRYRFVPYTSPLHSPYKGQYKSSTESVTGEPHRHDRAQYKVEQVPEMRRNTAPQKLASSTVRSESKESYNIMTNHKTDVGKVKRIEGGDNMAGSNDSVLHPCQPLKNRSSAILRYPLPCNVSTPRAAWSLLSPSSAAPRQGSPLLHIQMPRLAGGTKTCFVCCNSSFPRACA